METDKLSGNRPTLLVSIYPDVLLSLDYWCAAQRSRCMDHPVSQGQTKQGTYYTLGPYRSYADFVWQFRTLREDRSYFAPSGSYYRPLHLRENEKQPPNVRSLFTLVNC